MKISLIESIVVAAFAVVVTLVYVVLAALLGWQTELLKSDFGLVAVSAVFAGTTILTWIVWRILRHAFYPVVDRLRLRRTNRLFAESAREWRKSERGRAKLNPA